MPTAIGYIRVSTDQQAKEGVSLDAQQSKIAAWAELNNYTLGEIFIDAGISGKTIKKRPGVQQALNAVGRGDALVVYKLDRLSRSIRDTMDIADRLEKIGADLVSLSERIDTSGAAGRMIFRLLAVMAQFEREQTAERVTATMVHLRASGRKYSTVPFGYLEGDQKTLVPVDSELLVVEEVKMMRERGDSLHDIARELNGRGLAGKNGGKWFASTVRHLLKRVARDANLH